MDQDHLRNVHPRFDSVSARACDICHPRGRFSDLWRSDGPSPLETRLGFVIGTIVCDRDSYPLHDGRIRAMTLKRRPAVLVGVILVLMAGAVGAPMAQSKPVSLFEGEWRTDVPDMSTMSASIVAGVNFTVTATQVKMTWRFVTPVGISQSVDEVLQVDGKTRVINPEVTLVVKWVTPFLLDVVSNGASRTVHTTYSLSADQRTLTFRSAYSDNGHIIERKYYR